MTRRAYCSKCRRFIDIPDSRSGPSDNTYGISCPNCQASWEHLTVQRLRVNLPGVVASIAVPIGFMLLINPPNLGVLFPDVFPPQPRLDRSQRVDGRVALVDRTECLCGVDCGGLVHGADGGLERLRNWPTGEPKSWAWGPARGLWRGLVP